MRRQFRRNNRSGTMDFIIKGMQILQACQKPSMRRQFRRNNRSGTMHFIIEGMQILQACQKFSKLGWFIIDSTYQYMRYNDLPSLMVGKFHKSPTIRRDKAPQTIDVYWRKTGLKPRKHYQSKTMDIIMHVHVFDIFSIYLLVRSLKTKVGSHVKII